MAQACGVTVRVPFCMDDSLISVGALHALAYCERLFYLEEVERIRVADAAVFAGRRLHTEIERAAGDQGDLERRTFASDHLGLRGTVDVITRRDGAILPYEHKRGRAAGRRGAREPWPSDRIQLGAYAMLVEDATGEVISEARIRYHADGVTIRLPIDDSLRAEVRKCADRARALRTSTERPPITDNERLCVKCSLVPVCLPEEARLAADPSVRPKCLLPRHPKGKTIHITTNGARVGRRGGELVIRMRDKPDQRVPIHDLASVVLHGFAQITTQAIRLCASHDVAVHWMTQGGGLVGSLAKTAPTAQRHIRQFEGLLHEGTRLELAKRLIHAKIEHQLRFVLRATRGVERAATVKRGIDTIRISLRKTTRAACAAELLGYEGNAAAAYFRMLPLLVKNDVDEALHPIGRSRLPPKDAFNALLSYGYGMLYREVLGAIVAVGLHPGFGFYHRPRSAAHTLALDIMELFRVVLVDMPMIAAVNRKTFDVVTDFASVAGGIHLTAPGRHKAIEVTERRRHDTWRHSATGHSLSYARIIELETRLLEKEWSGEPGLFARFRIR